MAVGERTRVGTGRAGAMVPYTALGAAQGAMRDPRAAAAYYNLPQKSAQAMQQAGALFPRAALLGGSLLGAAPGIASAVESAGEGRTLEAATTGLGTLGGLGLGSLAANRIGGFRGGLIGAGISVAGGLLGQGLGQAAERKKAEETGQPISGQEGSASEQRGRTRKQAELELEMRGAGLDQNMQFLQQFTGMMMNAEREQLQKLMPLMEKSKDLALTRQQALMNTQGQNYAMLGTLATAGKLATGAQEQAGATLRTALTSNPYANSVLQAPNISFG